MLMPDLAIHVFLAWIKDEKRKEISMNQIFTIPKPFQVPDGTRVSPFLNSKDCMSRLPFNLLDGASLSMGIIKPHTQSKIHIMPHVTQITYVLRGNLEVKMKGLKDAGPYHLSLGPKQAIITELGAFFQLINNTARQCTVLYIVTPAYLFEMGDDKVVYDDSLVLDESWDDLKAAGWCTKASLPTLAERQAAYGRLEHVVQSLQRE
jgi:mannose-6-phosphate isomerase-like protein (cupin superfamily)